VAAVARENAVDRYNVYQMLRRAIERSEYLELYLRGSRRDATRNARWLLARMIALYATTEGPAVSL
jgi:hypothetical protein